MATLISIPTAVTVLAPGSSVLSTIVAAMAPGSWSQLNVGNQSAILGVGDSTRSMLPYTNAMPWNHRKRRIEILARDHNDGAFGDGIRHASYDEATNTFMSHGRYAVFPMGHGYDHTEVNPFTGDLYHRPYGSYSETQSRIRRQVLGGTEWELIPSRILRDGITCGTCWWSGPFTGGGGLGAQGGLVIYTAAFSRNGADDGEIAIFDPVSNSWKFHATGVAPFQSDGYNESMAYSRSKNVAVYGGTNPSPRKIWKMVSTGATSALADVPLAAAGVGVHKGVLVDEPVSGNFLLLSRVSGGPALYELNPDGAGTWTLQTGSRTPPFNVGSPGESGPNNFVMGVPLPDHGVVAFIRQSGAANGAFWLYKHA